MSERERRRRELQSKIAKVARMPARVRERARLELLDWARKRKP